MTKTKKMTVEQAKHTPRRELCAMLGVVHTTGWPDLLALVEKHGAAARRVTATAETPQIARLAKILTALSLPPDANEKQVVDKLVRLSDEALAGRQIVERLLVELGLPLQSSIDALLATVKGYRELVQKNDERFSAVLEALQVPHPATFEGVLERIAMLKTEPSGNESAKDALDEIREAIEIEDGATAEEVVQEVKWLRRTCLANRDSSDAADRELTVTQRKLNTVTIKLDRLRQASWRLASLTAVVGAEGRKMGTLLDTLTNTGTEEDE